MKIRLTRSLREKIESYLQKRKLGIEITFSFNDENYFAMTCHLGKYSPRFLRTVCEHEEIQGL